MQAKALEQLRNSKPLTGKDGVFAPLLKQFIETAFEAEMSSHLDEIERISGNKPPCWREIVSRASFETIAPITIRLYNQSFDAPVSCIDSV